MLPNKKIPNIKVWNQYTNVSDIVDAMRALSIELKLQWGYLYDLGYICNYTCCVDKLLDLVAFKKFGITRPSGDSFGSSYDSPTTIYDIPNVFGKYTTYDDRGTAFKLTDVEFKKYIFWITRLDQNCVNIPNIIQNVVDFTELNKNDISITVTGNKITINAPNTLATETLEALINFKLIPTPIGKVLEIVLF